MVIAFCGVSKSIQFLLRYSTFSLSSSNHANLQYFKLITNPFTPKTTLSLSRSSLHHHRQSFTPILTILLSRVCDSTPFISLNKQSVHLRQSRNHSFCLFIPLLQNTLFSSNPLQLDSHKPPSVQICIYVILSTYRWVCNSVMTNQVMETTPC